ncbi:DHA2 family efflux MFS transporter permease subunit [Paenibacillus kobensis]|uniref:DHA2 family efflux MFS transporter permease subunit n=1 Tax=Paenibacillus kobensis TaxID=59841 RepID=UPI000FDAC615|nr:DHA2 family efflux MFS transporter permease subunit [Paenibacillus kobensis]
MIDVQNSPRRWWMLLVLAVSLLVVGLDMTVLNLAMPVLAEELHATTSQLQWFANAYNLVLAAALLPAGMLGDRFGSKKVLLTALVLFGGASMACAYANDASTLIAARAVLGLGAALLMPVSLSLLPVLFKEEERPKALRIWATASALGLPLGPILGGWLLDHYVWGSIFLINVPIVLFGLIAVALLLPKIQGSVKKGTDIPGILLSSAGLAVLTFGVTRSGEEGLGDALTLTYIAAGIVLLVLFVWRQRRAAAPLISLSLFREPRFTWGALLATVVSFALFGVLFGLPLLFQSVGGLNPQITGLRLLPLIGGLVVGAQLSGKLINRLNDKAIVAAGFVLMAAGLGLGGLTGLDTGYGYTAVWITLVGMGVGFALPTAMDAALGALPPEQNGIGSALTMALRQVGGTIGVALLGAVMNAVYRNRLDMEGLADNAAEEVQSSVSSGIATAKQLDSAALLESVRSSFSNGFDAMLWTCSGVALLGFVLAVVFLPNKKQAGESSAGTAAAPL